MNNINNLVDFFKHNNYSFKENEPLKNHTSFNIGGNAKIFVMPDSEEQLKEILLKCEEFDVKYYLLGNGTNVLFPDDGYDGVIISTTEKFNGIRKLSENSFECDAGVKLTSLCKFALENSYTGFECLFGIPGTVGGAIITNAGAYGSEVSDVIVEVNHIDDKGNFGSFIGEEIDFSYRHSAYEDNHYMICSAVFVCEQGNKAEIKAKMDELIQRRKEKQPLEFGSAGSTFKRPKEGYAAALIEQAGLKGTSVGGAEVSTKHSGFVINKGNATCKDVLKLIEIIKQKVFENSGVKLECEVRIVT
ncbi:MAG: UDP-N-acetylmuramate dehydrogenase [Acutalibacteraceae bacterium]